MSTDGNFNDPDLFEGLEKEGPSKTMTADTSQDKIQGQGQGKASKKTFFGRKTNAPQAELSFAEMNN